LLIIGTNFFFQYCQPAQIQPKSQFLFHKNCSPRDLCIMTLITVALTSTACHRCHCHILFLKIKARPRSCRSYLPWRPCFPVIIFRTQNTVDDFAWFCFSKKPHSNMKNKESTLNFGKWFEKLFWKEKYVSRSTNFSNYICIM